MSDLITDEHFTDGQSRINASNMNGIVSRAKVQPDVISSKPESATMNVSDYILVLKTDNTLAKAKFSTIVNSTASAIPIADATKNGSLRQVSGLASDYVGGDNACHPLVPPGTVWEYAGQVASIPAGWLNCTGQAISRTTYAALFAAIGAVYGAGDGSTTFNVPNCAGRLTATVGGTFGALGTFGGNTTVALAVTHMPSHAHSITDVQHTHGTVAHSHFDSGHQHQIPNVFGQTFGAQGGGATTYIPNGTTTTAMGSANLDSRAPNTDARFTGITATLAAGSGTGFNVLNPYIVFNRMIKT